MAKSYAVFPFAQLTRPSKHSRLALGRARTTLFTDAVEVALPPYVRGAEAAWPVDFDHRILPWRRTSTAAVRCLAWMEGKPGAVARQSTLAALPQALTDHELARIARDWAERYLSRSITWHAADHSALRPRSTELHSHILISRRQG